MSGNRFWIIALVLVILVMAGIFVFEERISPPVRPGSSETAATTSKVPASAAAYTDAVALYQLNRFPGAEAAARKLIDQGGDTYSGNNLLGLVLIETGRYDEAIALFQANANAQPSNPLAYSNAGEAFRRSNRPTEALVPLQRAVELDPTAEFYQFKLRMAQIEAGKSADLMARTAEELKKTPPASDWLMTAAGIALAQKNWKEASIILKNAEDTLASETLIEFLKDPLFKKYASQPELAKTFPKPQPKIPPGPVTQKALIAASKKDFSKALDLLAQAEKAKEPPVYIHTVKGLIFMSQAKSSEAAREFQDAADLSPKDPTNLVNLGQALRANKKPREAATAFKKALYLAPRNEIYAVKLAFALVESGLSSQVLAMNGSGPLLIGKAAAAAEQRDLKSASTFLNEAKKILPPEMMASLLEDPVFQPYRNSPELGTFFTVQTKG